MAWYRSGTVTLTNGSATVTGSGTAFIANASIGEGFLGPDGRTYEITNIASDTSLTISPTYQGSTAGGQGYAIAPLRGRIADLISETSSLLASFATVRDGVGAGLFPDGTAETPAGRFANDQDTGFYRFGSNLFGIAAGGLPSLIARADGAVVVLPRPAPSRSPALELGRWADGGGSVFNFDVQDAGGTSTGWLKTGRYGGDLYFSHDSESGEILAIRLGLRTNDHFLDLYGPNADNVYKTRLSATGTSFFGYAAAPRDDNGTTLGLSSNRWSVVYAGTGTINTSDERHKHWRGELNSAELSAARRIIAELGVFQWNDAVEEKGENGARLHFGVRAQQAFAIMEDEGLAWGRYAWCCHDEWDEVTEPVLGRDGRPTGQTQVTIAAGERYGVRPDQLAFWLIAAQAAMQADLEARIAALEVA